MNGLERIRTAINFQTPDRVPVIAQVFGHAATLADTPLETYIRNGEVLADCQLKAMDYYGYDAVFALMDVHVEAEAVGSVLDYRLGQYPFVRSHVLAGGDSLTSLSVPDPHITGRMPELLNAADILRNRVGDDVLVVGCVAGPMTLAIQLLGIEHTLYLAADDPEEFARLLAFSAEVIMKYGTAQIAAGAHLPVVFDPAASPAVIPPQFFREFELPHTCIDGNIKPLLFLVESPDSVENDAAALLKLFSKRGGYILSPGCEIPPEAKPENIKRMVSAVLKK